MSSQSGVGLPEALERAASALPNEADAIRPANGDPIRLIELLEGGAASRVLRWLLAEEPADGAELVDAWLEVPERGAAAVLGVEAEGLPKLARKALRRAHHQLRSRGIAVPTQAAEPTLATLPNVEEALDEAILSPLDPRGGRAAYLVSSRAQGGVRLFEVMFDDARGILDCRVYSTGRGKVRKFLKEFERTGGLGALPVAPAAVRALVRRAAAAHPTSRPLPRGFVEWRGQIADAEDETATPGDLAREALGANDEVAALRRVATLFEKGEFGPWPPDPEALKEIAEKLESIATSTVIVSPEQRREQSNAVIDDAVPSVFTDEFAAQTAARLDETAFVLWRREHEEDARACLGAADAFRAGKDLAENPVARAMLEAVFGPALARNPGDAVVESSA